MATTESLSPCYPRVRLEAQLSATGGARGTSLSGAVSAKNRGTENPNGRKLGCPWQGFGICHQDDSVLDEELSTYVEVRLHRQTAQRQLLDLVSDHPTDISQYGYAVHSCSLYKAGWHGRAAVAGARVPSQLWERPKPMVEGRQPCGGRRGSPCCSVTCAAACRS